MCLSTDCVVYYSVCVCVCPALPHCDRVQVNLSMSDAKVTHQSIFLPCQRLCNSAEQRSWCSKTQLEQQAGNEWGGWCRSQLMDKEVLTDLVRSLSVSFCNFITVKRKLLQVTGAAVRLHGADGFIFFYRFSLGLSQILWVQLSKWNKSVNLRHPFYNKLNKWNMKMRWKKKAIQSFLFLWNVFNCLVHLPAVHTSAPTSHAELYPMIEGSSKLLGPTMHPCSQLNHPPSNLRRTISEAPYRALPSTSWPLCEALKLIHRANPPTSPP